MSFKIQMRTEIFITFILVAVSSFSLILMAGCSEKSTNPPDISAPVFSFMERSDCGGFAVSKINSSDTFFESCIDYQYDGGDGAGSFLWTIPDSTGELNRIRVESVNNPYDVATSSMATYVDTDSNNFVIRGDIELTQPNTAVNFDVNETINIAWTPTGALGGINITLYYDNDGFPYANTFAIATNYTGGNSYPWTPTDKIAENSIQFRL